MAISDDYSPERLADRAQIQDVMLRWCRAIDRLDLEAIRSVFHPGATDNHGMYNGDIDGLVKWIGERHKGIPFSMHSIANMTIEFGGPDTAVVETYCFAVQRYSADGGSSLTQLSGGTSGKAGSATDLMAFGRYIDRFERKNGEWRIQKRTMVYDSTMMFEVPANAPRMAANWVVGQRNKSDVMSEQQLEERLRKVEDLLSIYQLMSAYGPAADSCNMEDIARIWTQDCVYEIGGLGEFKGHAGLKEAFDGEFHQGIVKNGSAHAATMPHVVVDGDSASATHYGTLFTHENGEFTCRRVIASRWLFVRTPDKGWQIKRRTNILLNGSAAARELLSRAMQPPEVG
jgi:ketosteroid isomerase-like protein